MRSHDAAARVTRAALLVLAVMAAIAPSGNTAANALAASDDTARATPPYVIVQGVIYCQMTPCELSIHDHPLPGATARLVCHGNGRKVIGMVTDHHGHFVIQLYEDDLEYNFDVRNCKLYLGRSPTPMCNHPLSEGVGLSLVRDSRTTPPEGLQGIYRPSGILSYGPSGRKCA